VPLTQLTALPAARCQVWKVPTGLVHAGEDLCDAAEREVWEETVSGAGLQGSRCTWSTQSSLATARCMALYRQPPASREAEFTWSDVCCTS
jgi:hypothetical protein